jgi:hypothetical protein
MAALIVDHQTKPPTRAQHSIILPTTRHFLNTPSITLQLHSSLVPSKPVPGYRFSFPRHYWPNKHATTPKHNASVKRPPHPSRKPPSTRHNHLFPRQPILLSSSYIYRNKQNPNQVTTCYVFPPSFPLCFHRLSRPRASVECPGEPSDRILDRRRSVFPSSEVICSMSR